MADSHQIEILSDLLETASRNFEANESLSGSLDDKAQKTSGLAGLFVAAAFGFLKPDDIAKLHDRYGSVSLVLLIASITLFIIAIGLCLRAMWLRIVPIGGVSIEAHELGARIVLSFKEEEIDDELIREYKENELALWKQLVKERIASNAGKAVLLQWGQRVLAAGIAATALNIVMLVFVPLVPPVLKEVQKNVPKQTKTESSNDTPKTSGGNSVPGGTKNGVDPEHPERPEQQSPVK